MTCEEIIEILKEKIKKEGEYFEIDGLDVINIENYGGEGKGDDAHSVYKVTENGTERFFKADYSYYSHYGYSYDYLEVYEVEESEKTIKYWKRIL